MEGLWGGPGRSFVGVAFYGKRIQARKKCLNIDYLFDPETFYGQSRLHDVYLSWKQIVYLLHVILSGKRGSFLILFAGKLLVNVNKYFTLRNFLLATLFFNDEKIEVEIELLAFCGQMSPFCV